MTKENILSEFVWPLAKNLTLPLQGQQLYKSDSLLHCIESLVDRRRAWAPIVGGTKRTEPESKLRTWLTEQTRNMHLVERSNRWNRNVSIEMDEFPEVSTNKRIIGTAKSILYLIDSTIDLLGCIRSSFGEQAKAKANEILDVSLPALLFISNSVESGGRAFGGDPFTGQVAAFSRIFCADLLGNKERNFVAYYPHQLYTQFFNANGRKVDNKGANVLQNLADLIITAKGILIKPSEWRVL
jgi:hypothetical protein